MFRVIAFVVFIALVLLMDVADAQQAQQATNDGLLQVYQQQRNAEADARAQCIAVAVGLQSRVAELEKQLSMAKAELETLKKGNEDVGK
jgi:hypothetical protein